MASQQQFPALPVVPHSHLTGELAAAPAAAATSASYSATLGVAYAFGPLLAFAVEQALSRVFPGGAVALVAGGLLLLLPAATHVLHGATERAWRAFAGMLGYTALVSLIGAVIGFVLGKASCEPALDHECGLTTLAWLLAGAASGALLGYSAHARRDVAHHSSLLATADAAPHSVP